MNLCHDCAIAERDPLHAVYNRGQLCCAARAVAKSPRSIQRQAFDAVTSGLSPLEAHEVRCRAYALMGRDEPEMEA